MLNDMAHVGTLFHPAEKSPPMPRRTKMLDQTGQGIG
jgi:hypothetical protein